jgi:hypothetical protein
MKQPSKKNSDHREGDKFDLDAAAMIGYQLFAFSCIATQDAKAPLKHHLFEILIRAQQLGGEEARVALVCCVNDPQQVQAEVEQDWLVTGKIKVFGRPDLLILKDRLRDWFDQKS